MLDHSFRERSVRKSQGSLLAEHVLKGWDLLRPGGGVLQPRQRAKLQSFHCLPKCSRYHINYTLFSVHFEELKWVHAWDFNYIFPLQIDSSVCSNTDHKAFNAVFTTFTALLTDISMPLNLKVTFSSFTLYFANMHRNLHWFYIILILVVTKLYWH